MDFPEIVTQDSPSRIVRKPRKKPGIENMLAAVLSFFIPGLGQLCQGRVAPGMAFLAAYIVGWCLVMFLIGIPIVLVTCIWAAVDAAQA